MVLGCPAVVQTDDGLGQQIQMDVGGAGVDACRTDRLEMQLLSAGGSADGFPVLSGGILW